MSEIQSPEPMRSGTWEREALSHYLVRWAEHLNVSVTTLLSKVLQPALPSSVTPAPNARRMIDRPTQQNWPWIEAAELVTGRVDLRELSLLGVSDCYARSPLRHHYAWCPYCLEAFADEAEADELNQAAFSPLIWRLPDYKLCIRHETRLELKCQKCGQGRQKLLWAGARVGCCSYCRRWMGRPFSGADATEDGDDLVLSICTAETLALPFLEPRCATRLASLFRKLASAKAVTHDELAQLIGLTADSIEARISGSRRVTIEDVARLAGAMRTSAFDLCAAPLEALKSYRSTIDSNVSVEVQTKREAKRAMITKVLAEISGEQAHTNDVPSPTAVCGEFDFHQQTARRVAPDSFEQLRVEYQEVLKNRSPFFQRLSEAIDKLILAEKFPTSNRLWKEERIFLIADSAKLMFNEERTRRGLPVGISHDPVKRELAMDAEIKRLRARGEGD